MTLKTLLIFLDAESVIILEDVTGNNRIELNADNPFFKMFTDLSVTNIYADRLYIEVKGLKGVDNE